MSQVIDITIKRKEDVKKQEQIKIDIEASCVIIEQCLKKLNLNNLKKLEYIKKELNNTLKDLENEKLHKM